MNAIWKRFRQLFASINRWRDWAVLIPVICLFPIISANPTVPQAQLNDFEVVIGLPNEGETFYAGPSSLLYNIPVFGYIFGENLEYDAIDISLMVIQDDTILDYVDGKVNRDGTFSFTATVNPDHPVGRFNRTDGEYDPTKLSCGECCHFPQGVTLPEGTIILKVIAKDQFGREAVDVRHIKVDLSDYMRVPVHVSVENMQVDLNNIKVVGSSRFYLWRTKSYYGITDAQGIAEINVEVLSQSETKIIFQVEPIIVDGVSYNSVENKTIVIKPDTLEPPHVYLELVANKGKILGELKGDYIQENDISIWAVHLPSGKALLADVSADGKFIFENIPLARYILILVNKDTNGIEAALVKANVDLLDQPQAEVEFSFEQKLEQSKQGQVTGIQGIWIPFSTVSVENNEQISVTTQPDSGYFYLTEFPKKDWVLVASAPGFYSQKLEANPMDDGAQEINLELTPSPDLTIITTDKSKMFLPPETSFTMENGNVVLDYGWIWGNGEADQELIIYVAGKKITIPAGDRKFAINYLPNQSSWLYVFSGEVNVSLLNNPDDIIVVQQSEMVNLLVQEEIQAVAYNPVLMFALDAEEPAVSFDPHWEPNLLSKFKKSVENISLGLSQLVVYAFYIVLIVIGGAGFKALLKEYRSKR
jgi:hypothetical protein